MTSERFIAPPLEATRWLNTERPIALADLRDRVVVLYAFQMLCPGCVARATPQAQRVAATFEHAPVTVLGLHTVFVHHDAMQPHALEVFLHEYRVTFPVGVDAPGPDGGAPRTMRAYGMRGTPTLVLIDRLGRRSLQRFGHLEDLELGARIAALVGEHAVAELPDARAPDGPASCDAGACAR